MMNPDAHVYEIHADKLDRTVKSLLALYEDSTSKVNAEGHTDVWRGVTLLATVEVVPDFAPERVRVESIAEFPTDLQPAVDQINKVEPGSCSQPVDGVAEWTMPSGIVHMLNAE